MSHDLTESDLIRPALAVCDFQYISVQKTSFANVSWYIFLRACTG